MTHPADAHCFRICASASATSGTDIHVADLLPGGPAVCSHTDTGTPARNGRSKGDESGGAGAGLYIVTPACSSGRPAGWVVIRISTSGDGENSKRISMPSTRAVRSTRSGASMASRSAVTMARVSTGGLAGASRVYAAPLRADGASAFG